jgi:tetratricopeptide (TPR) repeat protein
MAVALNNAGYLYARLGRCDEARTALVRSVGVWKALGASGIDGVMETGSSLVSVYLDCGDAAVAAAFWKKELEPLYMRLPVEGILYARLSMIAGTLGLVRRDYPRAEQLLTTAITILQNQKTPESNELALILNDRAVVRMHLSRNDDAAADLERAIGILEENHVNDDIGLAKAVGNLAMVHRRNLRLAEAERGFRRARSLLDGKPDHLSAAAVAHEYAGLLRRAGRTDEASLMEREARSQARLSHTHTLRQTVDLSELMLR